MNWLLIAAAGFAVYELFFKNAETPVPNLAANTNTSLLPSEPISTSPVVTSIVGVQNPGTSLYLTPTAFQSKYLISQNDAQLMYSVGISQLGVPSSTGLANFNTWNMAYKAVKGLQPQINSHDWFNTGDMYTAAISVGEYSTWTNSQLQAQGLTGLGGVHPAYQASLGTRIPMRWNS